MQPCSKPFSRIKVSIRQQILIAFIVYTFVSRLHAWLPDRLFLARLRARELPFAQVHMYNLESGTLVCPPCLHLPTRAWRRRVY